MVIKFIFKILQCCFLCVERFLKFLTKNAYIEVRWRASAGARGLTLSVNAHASMA